MAEAAYTAAVAQRDRNTNASDNDNNNSHSQGQNDSTNVNANDNESSIEQIWKTGESGNENLDATLRLLVGELDNFVACGLEAFTDLDKTKRALTQAKELAEMKSREAERLQIIDEKSRTSLSSLLRAVESSKAEHRDSARSAQVEARLRTDINTLRDERDKALTELHDYRRKQSLLEEELRLVKSKLTRVTQDKNARERDSRAAISLARSLDNNNSNETAYYKRKVSELSDTISKQNNTIAELRGANDKRSRKSY